MLRAGSRASGVYTLHITNLSEPRKVSAATEGTVGPNSGMSPLSHEPTPLAVGHVAPLRAAPFPTVGVLRHGDRRRRLDGHPAPHQRQRQLPAGLEGVQAGLHRGGDGAFLHPPPTPTLPRLPQGFGDTAGEHWLGNEAVHLLTSREPYVLRVELRDWEGSQVYAHYGRFQLDSERQLYRWVSSIELSLGTAAPEPPALVGTAACLGSCRVPMGASLGSWQISSVGPSLHCLLPLSPGSSPNRCMKLQ